MNAVIPTIITFLLCLTSFLIILDEHEKSHRNFEYIQCELFSQLAEKHNETLDFNCQDIIDYGVLSLNLMPLNKNTQIDRDYIKTYAYHDEVEELRNLSEVRP